MGTDKILIVDDDSGTVLVLEKFLTKADFSVITASSAIEGSEKIKNEFFPFIITDINMPVMNGLDFLLWIKNFSPDSHVIIITAYGTDEIKDFVNKNGALDYFEKPVNLNKLHEVIKTVSQVKLKDKINKLDRLTRRERLGELIVRTRILSLSKLAELMEIHKKEATCPFGEFLVEKEFITRSKLIELLNLQKNQDRVIDKCLKELGYMTNQQKWENLTRHDKLGEILIRQKKINLAQLIDVINTQENKSPEKLLGEIFVETGYINRQDLKIAIDTQQKQIQTLLKTIQELTNISQLPINIKIRHMNSLWGS